MRDGTCHNGWPRCLLVRWGAFLAQRAPCGGENFPAFLRVRVVRYLGVIFTSSEPPTTGTASTIRGRPCRSLRRGFNAEARPPPPVSTVPGGSSHFLVGSGWFLLFPGGLWMVPLISWWALDGCCHFLVGFGWFLLFPGGLWMVAVISWWAPDPPSSELTVKLFVTHHKSFPRGGGFRHCF